MTGRGLHGRDGSKRTSPGPDHGKENQIMTAETGTMGDELLVTDLVTRARNGDKQAWDALVERYAPLVWSICRRHRLGGAEAERGRPDRMAAARGRARDGQRSGSAARLARHGNAAGMRPGPAGSEGGSRPTEYMLDAGDIPGGQAGMVEHELRTGRAPHGAALGVHAPAPPRPAADRHARRGPSRARTPRSAPGWASRPGASGRTGPAAWSKLRRYPAVAALINADRPAALTHEARRPSP